MMCQGRLIHCNKGTTLLGNVDSGAECGGTGPGHVENLCNFREYMAVNLKNKVYFLKNEEVRKKRRKEKQNRK